MSSLKKVTQKGFTIVELLIVIVVIGILAALVITTYSGIQQRARDTERQTDLKALQGHLETYYTDNGSYPASDELGSTSATNLTFIGDNMKGLKREALRDPKAAAGAYALGTTATATQYGYAPTNDDEDACTAAAGDCTKYTLTAIRESDKTTITVGSN